MVDEPAGDRNDVVLEQRDAAVRTEQCAQRPPAGMLVEDDEHRSPERDRPGHPVRRQPPEHAPEETPARLEPRIEGAEDHDRGHERGQEHDPLRPRVEGDQDRGEDEQLSQDGRPLEREIHRQHDEGEGRIERVLGHHRRRVGHRRGAGPTRQPSASGGRTNAGQEVDRHRRERHHERVDRPRRFVGPGHVAEERVRRRDQHRVDDPEAVGPGHVSDRERARAAQAAAEVGIGDLVVEDPGPGVALGDREPDPGRDADSAATRPRPGRRHEVVPERARTARPLGELR